MNRTRKAIRWGLTILVAGLSTVSQMHAQQPTPICVLGLTGQAETMVPITDANVQAGLSPYNWICTKDFISSSVCGASLSVGFKGTKQVAILVDSAMAARKDPMRIPVIAWSVNGGALQTYQFGLEEKSFVLASGVQDPVIDLYIKGMSPSERRRDTDLPVNSLA